MILVDTGPIVAIASKRDQNHARCLTLLPTLVGPLVTTWACVAESMHLVYRFGGHAAQDEIWGYITDGLLEIHIHDETERLQMRALMNQYRDTPMDLADASRRGSDRFKYAPRVHARQRFLCLSRERQREL